MVSVTLGNEYIIMVTEDAWACNNDYLYVRYVIAMSSLWCHYHEVQDELRLDNGNVLFLFVYCCIFANLLLCKQGNLKILEKLAVKFSKINFSEVVVI